MKKVFIDTNVILDFLMKRSGFFDDARIVMAFPFSDIDVVLPSDLIKTL